MKRIGGAPTASARADGRARRRLQPPQGRRTAANLRDVGVNVDLAPVLDVARPGGDDRRDRTRLRLDRRRGSPRPRSPSPRAAGRRRGGDRQALPRPRRGRREHRLRGPADRALRSATLRAVDEAPYRAFVAAGGELVMLSTAIYRPSRPARPPSRRRDRRPASCAPASASRASRSPTRWTPSRCALSAGRQRRRSPPRAAGADLLLFTDLRRPSGPGARCCAELRRGELDALGVRGLGAARAATCADGLARPPSSARRTCLVAIAGSKTRTRVAAPVLRRVHRRVGLARRPTRSWSGCRCRTCATPTLAVIGGTPSRSAACSRIAVAIASATASRLAGLAAGQDDRELVAAESRQHVGLAGAPRAGRRRSPRSPGPRPGARACR